MDRKLNIEFHSTSDQLWDNSCKKTVCPGQGMLSNSFTPLVGGFSDNNYWSSSENNANNAWKQNFNNGNQNNNNKNNNNKVRCIRPFDQNNTSCTSYPTHWHTTISGTRLQRVPLPSLSENPLPCPLGQGKRKPRKEGFSPRVSAKARLGSGTTCPALKDRARDALGVSVQGKKKEIINPLPYAFTQACKTSAQGERKTGNPVFRQNNLLSTLGQSNRNPLPCFLEQGKKALAQGKVANPGFSQNYSAKAHLDTGSACPALKDRARNNLLFTIGQSNRNPLPCFLEQGKKALGQGNRKPPKAGFSPRVFVCPLKDRARDASGGEAPKQKQKIELHELFEAYYDCRKNKRKTKSALQFELDYEAQLIKLHEEINTCQYTPGRGIAFIVDKPVKREIFAAAFRDRIVHHLIINKLNPYFEKYFIYDSYSCRKNKGTHFGINRIKRFIRAASGNYKNNAWILKLDIRAFFMNINKNILLTKLEQFIDNNYKLPDQQLVKHLCRIILLHDCRKNCLIKGNRKKWDHLPPGKSLFSKPHHKGIPIGNLTSQVFANFYLSAMDHFIKHDLGIRYYGRYVDDFILVHPDKEFLLECHDKIRDFIKKELDLELHPGKTYLQHFSKGVKFLGCMIKPGRVYINKRTKTNMYRSIQKHNTFIREKKKISPEELKKVQASLNSYLGILKHYDTYKMRKTMLWKHLSGYYFNYLYISGNYGKMTNKIKKVKSKYDVL